MKRRVRRSQSHPNRGAQSRPGFAMFMALGALVIIGVLVAGSSFITLQETRLGQNSIVQTRAFAAAEYGLNKIQADWDKTPNLQMANGASYDTNYTLAGQGTCKVRYTRLNNETFWIVSEGRALMGNSVSASRTAVKRVGAILRLRIPSIRANGAITTAGNIDVQGSPQISGLNSMPSGWSGCSAAPNMAGIVASPTASVTIQKASQVIGTPQILRDPLAADSNTYVRYGDETWNALVAMANVTITNGQGPTVEPTALPDGSCDKGNQANWGEPWRTAGWVEACKNYFPIVYSTTSLHMNQGRGQGILLVDGDVRFNGDFEWYGLIVARDDITKGNGVARIFGAVMARNAELGDMSDVQGNITINYSQCSLEMAMRGSAQVLQAKERAWAELY